MLKLGKITSGDKSRRWESTRNNSKLLPLLAITLETRKSSILTLWLLYTWFLCTFRISCWWSNPSGMASGCRGFWRWLKLDYVMRIGFPLWDSCPSWLHILWFSTSLSVSFSPSVPSSFPTLLPPSLHFYTGDKDGYKNTHPHQDESLP